MYLQEIIEVAIGLIFAWLLLSIAVLQIQEVIARLASKRSQDLYNAIENMLNDPKVLDDFYKHPLIESLKTPPSGVRDWFKKKFSGVPPLPHNPSYIPAETFARVLFDLVIKAGTEESPITATVHMLQAQVVRLDDEKKKTAYELMVHLEKLGNDSAAIKSPKLKKELREAIHYLLDKLAMVDINNEVLKECTDELKAYVDGNHAADLAIILNGATKYLDQVRNGALLLSNTPLGRALDNLLAGVNEYATEADTAIAIGRKNVEKWFDSTMERLTGSYKRWAQMWAFVIGFILAIALNVDTLYIARELWRNPALRQASAIYVENFVEKNTEDGSILSDTDLRIINDEIEKLSYPTGWDEINKQIKEEVVFDGTTFAQSLEWIWFGAGKLIGWLFTALATMQGAPFWFDTLKKLVNVRSAGINPVEKPKENASK